MHGVSERGSAQLGGLGILLFAMASMGWCLLDLVLYYGIVFPSGFYLPRLPLTATLIVLEPFVGAILYFMASSFIAIVGLRLMAGQPLRSVPYVVGGLLSAEAIADGVVYLDSPLTSEVLPFFAGVLGVMAMLVYGRTVVLSKTVAGFLGAFALILRYLGSPYAPQEALAGVSGLLSTSSFAYRVVGFHPDFAGLVQWFEWGCDLIFLALGVAIAAVTLVSFEHVLSKELRKTTSFLLGCSSLLLGLGFLVVGFFSTRFLYSSLEAISGVQPTLVTGLGTTQDETTFALSTYAVTGLSGIVIAVASCLTLLRLGHSRENLVRRE
jgi:hypothetical protein